METERLSPSITNWNTLLCLAYSPRRVVLPPNSHEVILSPGQTIATCQRNISQHCWAQHVVFVWPPCCDVLRHVGCCWVKFENGQIWANNTQHVATCRNRVAKRTQHVAPNNVAICWVGMLRSFGRGFKGDCTREGFSFVCFLCKKVSENNENGIYRRRI